MPNRLIHEKSPYLLQHANNPVDWFAWGPEAFEAARSRDLPIFLSIGYSTCHWCHVMERESFEDQAVARYLNEHFIAIKVDREERPDIDEIYMAAVQAIAGGGGWPMSVFLTGELKPFYAGTYFPPQPAYGRPSFRQLIERISELWTTERQSLSESSVALTEALAERPAPTTERFGMESAEQCYDYFRRAYDPAEGGFGNAPKFPRPVQLDFLLNYWYRTGETKALEMSLFTLRKMASGGIYDQVGCGFHRYSVDRYWRVSHFEKMLYDQALLLHSYVDAWQITKDEFYSHVASGICDYVLRDLTSAEGAFYSAEDADSDGEEGKFYVWTKNEIEDLLGKNAALVIRHFGITAEGNFEHGKNVLHLTLPLEEIARDESRSVPDLREELRQSLRLLFSYREGRIRPHLDDKVLTSWNGLMIGAMARSGAALDKPAYLTAASRCADFLLSTLRSSTGLLHRWRDGESKIPAMLDDYVFLAGGLLHLYEATLEARWLDAAIELQREQDERLWDEADGGYFTSASTADMIVRKKNGYDGAEPSGNSVSARNLLKLAALTENMEYRARAEAIVRHFGAILNEHPYAMPELMVAAMDVLHPSSQLVLGGDRASIEPMHHVAARTYLPDIVTMYAPTARGGFVNGLSAASGPMAYVCRDFTCELPAHDVAALTERLQKVERAPKINA